MTDSAQNPQLKDIAQRLAHDYIRERREGIRLADELLKAGQYRDELRAMLDTLLAKELYNNVKEDAQKALNDDAARNAPSPHVGQPANIFGVRCANGHVTYYDKTRVCNDKSKVVREQKQGSKTMRIFSLKCDECPEMTDVEVDCEGQI